MGTWAAGPFGSDAALDFVDEKVSELVATVKACVDDPQIDDGFDEAFAAVALLNAVLRASETSTPTADEALRWRNTLIAAFDDQIESVNPQGDFKERQRAALLLELDALVSTCADFHAG